ncbi:MAG: hypothetical protein ACXW36_09105, partial [Nitrospira sp.]
FELATNLYCALVGRHRPWQPVFMVPARRFGGLLTAELLIPDLLPVARAADKRNTAVASWLGTYSTRAAGDWPPNPSLQRTPPGSSPR